MNGIRKVIVVGAGVSGLRTAALLEGAGREVIVLEARERVGGRTFSTDFEGERVDLGGQWVGPGQTRVLRLIKELGLETFPQYDRGRKRQFLGGQYGTYSGLIPKIGILPALDAGRALLRLGLDARGIPRGEPWLARNAAALDKDSLNDWMDRRVSTPAARDVIRVAARMLFCADPEELSALYALHYIRAGGGAIRLTSIRHGAQERRVIGGVSVRTGAGDFEGAACVLALPPAMIDRIGFTPGLPEQRGALNARMPMGSAIKCIVSYDTPFWREAGLSGEAVADAGPLSGVFDECDAHGRQAALVGFVVADEAKRLSLLSADERKRIIIEALAKFFGERALAYRGYIERDWTREEFSAGCYVGLAPPGLLSASGAALRANIGPLFFAGTETAAASPGYIEGALEAAERVAREIVR